MDTALCHTRQVTITEVFETDVWDRRGDKVIGKRKYVSVSRNTSRRRQAIAVSTLLAKYQWQRWKR